MFREESLAWQLIWVQDTTLPSSDPSLAPAEATSRLQNRSVPALFTSVAIALVFVLLAGRLLRLTYRYAVNIFFWDQWVFHNADLFQKHSLWHMFRWQFGPHRLGVGPLVSRLIEPHFEWNSRAASFLAWGILVLAAAAALWLKKRLYGHLTITDVVIPIIYLSAAQYELIFINSNLAQPLPLLLITLYGLCWTIQNQFARWLFVLLVNFLTTYTGYGLFLGLLTPPLLVVDYWVHASKRRATTLFFAVALLLSCASFASFIYDYKLQPGVNCFSLNVQTPANYFWYMSLMFANFFGVKGSGYFARLIGSLVIGCLVLALALAIRNIGRRASPSSVASIVSAILVAFSLLFAISTAFGRVCLGLDSAQASRYITFLATGIFGAYLQLLSLPNSKLKHGLLVLITIALLTTIPIRAQDRGLMRYFSEIKRNWRDCYLSAGNIATCDQIAGYKIDPEPESVLQQKLEYLKQSRKNLFSGPN